MRQAGNLKLRNCFYHADVTDALIRQPVSDKTVPFKNHSVRDGYTLFAVDYDLGGSGKAYADKDSANYRLSTGSFTNWNQGWSYRNDGIDIEPCTDSVTNGYNVGWVEPGEWLQYTFNVAAEGIYSLKFRTSSPQNTGLIKLALNGNPVLSTVSIMNSGDFKSWTYSDAGTILLKKGKNTLRVAAETGGFNLNYIAFKGPLADKTSNPVKQKTGSGGN
jgi:endoglucanase